MHTYIHTYVHTYIHTYMYVHTAPHSTLVSLLCVWAASSGLSALPRASWEAFLELDTYLPTCLMYSTGCPFSNGSYSVLVPWSGGISWVLLRPTSEIIAVPPRHQTSQFTPLIGTGATLCSLCSYLYNPGPCILGGWTLCVAWASFVATIAPQDFLTLSTLASKLFF